MSVEGVNKSHNADIASVPFKSFPGHEVRVISYVHFERFFIFSTASSRTEQ